MRGGCTYQQNSWRPGFSLNPRERPGDEGLTGSDGG
jgi:hypothetical protein